MNRSRWLLIKMSLSTDGLATRNYPNMWVRMDEKKKISLAAPIHLQKLIAKNAKQDETKKTRTTVKKLFYRLPYAVVIAIERVVFPASYRIGEKNASRLLDRQVSPYSTVLWSSSLSQKLSQPMCRSRITGHPLFAADMSKNLRLPVVAQKRNGANGS